ncbi:MAG: tetratricopeptide repeat protein [Actinomycetota bacterium]
MNSGRLLSQLLVELRGERTQQQFASWLGIKRTLIANAEGGRAPGPTLRAALVKRFPKRVQDIATAISNDFPRPNNRVSRELSKSPETSILRRSRGLILHGRHAEAVNALQAAVADLADEEELVRCYRLLGEAHYVLQQKDKAYESWNQGLQIAVASSHKEIEAWMRNKIASQLTREDRFVEALNVVDEGLHRDFNSWKLWRRRGIVSWHAHDFAAAYAALTTAMEHGCPRQRSIHARGQVLAEWGQLEAAIDELGEAVANAETPLAVAYARNARAFALGQLGKTDAAFQEFSEVEKVEPNSGWLHYFKGRCFEIAGDLGLAADSYRKSLVSMSPPLNEPKRRFVSERLSEIDP